MTNYTGPITYGSLAAGSQPLTDFDTSYDSAYRMGTLQCSAVGTNTVTLTALSGYPTMTAYGNYQAVGFVAANTSTGSVNIGFGALGALPAYLDDGVTAVGSGAQAAGAYYEYIYNSALNSGGGGWQLTTASPTVNASSGASVVLLGTQAASNSSAIQFTSIPASYDQYEVRITNAIPANNGAFLYMQVTESNGSSWISSGYNYVTFGVPITGTPGGAGATSQSQIQIANATTNSTANQGVQGRLTAFGLGSSTLVKGFRWDGLYADAGNSGYPTLSSMVGNYGSDTNVVNGLQFYFSSGNIASGDFSLYGIRKA